MGSDKIIDLRSDTITQPSPAMREAMYKAELGDDVLREDPTVNRLEETAASILGKEAALFVASGTMGNLISLSPTASGERSSLRVTNPISVSSNEVGRPWLAESLHEQSQINQMVRYCLLTSKGSLAPTTSTTLPRASSVLLAY